MHPNLISLMEVKEAVRAEKEMNVTVTKEILENST
jgi:hypothetical protein